MVPDIGARAARIREAFHKVFREVPGDANRVRLVCAPGRVNLIGEHTDYNDGYVLPIAIDREVIIAASARSDRIVRLCSLDFDETVEFSLDEIKYDVTRTWSNYFRGVAYSLEEKGFKLLGMDALITGNIPQGAGLSSSAAMEVASAMACQLVSGFSMDGEEMVRLCQRAENEFVGVKCGIMDQFISRFGRKDKAVLLDCRTLAYDYVPLPATGVKIVISDTGIRRGLIDSEYNLRRRQCEEGIDLLRKKLPGIKALRDVSVSEFEEWNCVLPDVIRRRCRHVVYENDRVIRSVLALKNGLLTEFGRLMNESHESLRDLYEVSCPALDAMVEAAWKIDGVLGSRMTGGGFGGCTVSIVEDGAVDEFCKVVSREYSRVTGGVAEPRIYVCRAEDGAREI